MFYVFLGKYYKVAASVGYIRDLPAKSFGVSRKDFSPQYEITKPDVVARLRSLVSGAEEVYLATDPDREGEAIAWHLLEALALKNPKRVTFTEISESAVKKALANPRSVDMNLVAAQEARRVIDRIVGYQVSGPLTKAIKNTRFLSAGRVQTPALRIIVERERSIRKFKSTTHYGVEAFFAADTGEWKAVWNTRDFLPAGQDFILDASLAEEVSKQRDFKLLKFEKSEAKKSPPTPFSTSILQQAASSALQFSPQKTMQIAQKLYEAGHITYMRTDSVNFSAEAVNEIRAYLKNVLQLPLPEKPRTWKSKDGAQEAHEAIRPTHIEIEDAGDGHDEQALYRLIRLRALACQLTDAKYAVRKLTLQGAKVRDIPTHFSATGRICIHQGWQVVMREDDADSDEKDEQSTEGNNPIPELTSGDKFSATKAQVLTKKTTPPKRYNEAALVRELERLGIGRPATYAAIISGILSKEREYAKLDKRNLTPTAIGEKIIDTLVSKFSFAEYSYTKSMEDHLDTIAEGKATYQELVVEANAKLWSELQGFGGVSGKCEVCGSLVQHKTGISKAGKPYDFHSCSDCDATYQTEQNGSMGQRNEARGLARQNPEEAGGKCELCNNPVFRKTGTAKVSGKPYDFYGCSKCDATYWTEKDGSMGRRKEKRN